MYAQDSTKVLVKVVMLSTGRIEPETDVDILCHWRARYCYSLRQYDTSGIGRIKIVIRLQGIIPLWRRVRYYDARSITKEVLSKG